MDHGTRPTRATIQAPSGERPQTTTTSAGQKDPRRPLLPALIGACGDGDAPKAVWKDRHSRVLVVYEWGEAVEASPIHAVRVVDRAEAQTVEGCGGGVQVGETTHPISEALVGRQGSGGGAGVPADYESWMHRSGRVPPEGRGEDTEGEEGGPGPPYNVFFPLSFPWCHKPALRGEGTFPLSFLMGWLGALHDR